MAKNSQIGALNKVGQSVWYDNLSRDVLKSGELSSLITAGVSGLTSNPTIFKKAIADSTNYDADIAQLGKKGLSADDICEELMVGDVAAAADLLKSTFLATKGDDGHASIEVSPTLAHDTAGTVVAAKRLWKKLDRSNPMIKIPATAEGLPAIRQVIAEGINVNVTLIFSVDVYKKVADAYLSGLEDRVAAGKEISSIASVASFFVSRVDAICEKSFDSLVKSGKALEADRAKFFGKVGIANSKLAYAAYEEIFTSSRFAELKKKGARVQRPLWASTGTKNPVLSPVLYVEELAGKDTVNTMPPATLKALMEKATIGPRLHSGLPEAKELLSVLGNLGIRLNELLLDLQKEGVKSFAESYKELTDSIEKKRSAVVK